MTIFDAKSLLFTFFSKNNSFDIYTQFKDLVPISENEDLDRAIVRSALEEMAESKIIKSISFMDKDKIIYFYWILTQPLDRYDQHITLSYITTNAIFELLKESSIIYKNPAIVPEPLNIKEIDIQNLLILINTVLKK